MHAFLRGTVHVIRSTQHHAGSIFSISNLIMIIHMFRFHQGGYQAINNFMALPNLTTSLFGAFDFFHPILPNTLFNCIIFLVSKIPRAKMKNLRCVKTESLDLVLS